MSATAGEDDAENPQGKTFERAMTVVIDLAYIAPEHLTALYTTEAICYFLLDGFKGDKSEVERRAPREQRKEKSSPSGLQKQDGSLSEKEWQALLDVIRTLEVLIDCVVPKAAVKKQ